MKIDKRTREDLQTDIENAIYQAERDALTEKSTEASTDAASDGAASAAVEVSMADEIALFFVAIGIFALIFTLPWRMFRLARLAWRIDFSGKGKHFRASIISRLVVYISFWFGLLIAVLMICLWLFNE